MMAIIVLGLLGTAIEIRMPPPPPSPSRPRDYNYNYNTGTTMRGSWERPAKSNKPPGLLHQLSRVRLRLRNPRRSGHHPAFLIYPLVYFICCAPMAVGPMILASGVSIKQGYFLWAGAMIASNGWLDVALWSCTMIFLAPHEIKEAGLSSFAFLRTPSVEYGNMVWVEAGGVPRRGGAGGRRGGDGVASFLQPLARMLRRDGGGSGPRGDDRRKGVGWESLGGTRTSSDKNLKLDGITTKTTTTVVVEETKAAAGVVDGPITRAPAHPPAGGDDGITPRPSFVYSTEEILSVPRRVAHRF
jgi:hypothetical protein